MALDFQRHVVRAYANEEGTKNAISNSLIKRGLHEDEWAEHSAFAETSAWSRRVSACRRESRRSAVPSLSERRAGAA
jgi:hypothetical protein